MQTGSALLKLGYIVLTKNYCDFWQKLPHPNWFSEGIYPTGTNIKNLNEMLSSKLAANYISNSHVYKTLDWSVGVGVEGLRYSTPSKNRNSLKK